MWRKIRYGDRQITFRERMYSESTKRIDEIGPSLTRRRVRGRTDAVPRSRSSIDLCVHAAASSRLLQLLRGIVRAESICSSAVRGPYTHTHTHTQLVRRRLVDRIGHLAVGRTAAASQPAKLKPSYDPNKHGRRQDCVC